MNNEEIWKKTMHHIKDEVGDRVFELWFASMKLEQMSETHVVVEVPNRFFKEWVEDNHPTLFSDTIERINNVRPEVKYRIAAKEDEDLRKLDAKLEKRKTQLSKKGIYLNPRYTFENFVVGPSNQLVHAAAKKVAEAPGRAYNPLFIYGGVGLGKTHMMTAIGNVVVDRHRDFNVLYVSAEQFTNEVVSAFRHQRAEEFKNKFRGLDMLLIDDVQFVGGKTATQEELFHTLNTLYDSAKQIVLSSDRPPSEIKDVTDRLRSRFGMGLIADIQPPEVETKIAIIHKKLEADHLRLPDDVINYVASKIKSNIRDLEGCLIRLGAYSSLNGKPVDLVTAKALLRDVIKDDDRPLTVEAIVKETADYFGVKLADIRAKKRTKDVTMPRQVAMHLSRELTDASLSDIGKALGGRDHATVIYACKQIAAKIASDDHFRRQIDSLINKIR